MLASKTRIYGEANDEFKDRIELKAEIKNDDKHVEVIVYIPKELSSNLFTSIDQRDIKINLSRSYEDEYVENDERIRFNKNQTVTKELRLLIFLKKAIYPKLLWMTKQSLK